MASIASTTSSFFSAVVLAAFILTAPTVSALSTLPTRAPAVTAMATFTPLAITGYTILAVVISYSLIRGYYLLRSHVLFSATRSSLPPPVSAGRIPYFHFYSPFTFLRSRQKSTREPNSYRRHWPPLFSIFRRLTRPPSPLHLSDAELLPTTMPDSPSPHTLSLINLPITSTSSSEPNVQRHNSQFKQTRKLSKASSMDALPSYRPLTPVPVPVPVYIASLPPSTPPPPSPTPLVGMNDTDIQLVPITPLKRRYAPVDTTNPSDSRTPPPPDTFSAISPSPFNPTTIPSLINHAGPRPSSSSPSLFLSSRTLSSLSLSPRSLYMRSKSLGGVAVKKISPQTNSTPSQSERTCENIVEFDTSVDDTQPRSLNTREPADDSLVKNSELVSPRIGLPKFHLNFSSSSSSSVSSSGRSSEPLSPSPLTANSESAPSSAPLRTPRTISTTSYSSNDIVKTSENEPFLPQPNPLVDADINTDTGVVLGYGMNDKVSGWTFDAEEPVAVARVLEDFDDMFSISSYAKAPFLNSKEDGNIAEERLVDLEEMDRKMDMERVREDTWEWDQDVEDQMVGWDMGTEAMEGNTDVVLHVENEAVTSNGTTESTAFTLETALVDETPEDDIEAGHKRTEYSNSKILPLPETIETLPPLLNKPVEVPAISICTEDEVLGRKDSGFDSGNVSASSIDRATPISLSQTPTPPASPPREARSTPLPNVNKSLQGQVLHDSATTSPVMEHHALTVDVEAQEEDVCVGVNEDITIAIDVSLVDEATGVQETKEIAPLLDKPLVSSPASISSELPGSDGECEFTFNFEADDDHVRTGPTGDSLGVSSPIRMVAGWIYDTDEEGEEQDTEIDVEFSAPWPDDEVEGCDEEKDEERAAGELERSFVDGNAQSVNKVLEDKLVRDPVTQIISDPEVELVSSPASAEPISTSSTETAQDAVTTLVAAVVLALQPSTSLPGSFRDAAASPIPESLPEPVQDTCPPPLPQRRRRARTSLEEAIARTRSPLEVALAMQLRPGLGPGSDPAWMVRFMMVMWGWVFGLALGYAEN